MALARKCNICKKCFDPLDHGFCQMTKFKNPVFYTSKDVHENKVGQYLIEGRPDEYVDLCPDCTENFILFMNGYPLAIEKGYFEEPVKP